MLGCGVFGMMRFGGGDPPFVRVYDPAFFLRVLLNSGYKPFRLLYRASGTTRIAWAKTVGRIQQRYSDADIVPIQRGGDGGEEDLITRPTIFIDELDGGHINLEGMALR